MNLTHCNGSDTVRSLTNTKRGLSSWFHCLSSSIAEEVWIVECSTVSDVMKELAGT